jgi:hypothetical protein
MSTPSELGAIAEAAVTAALTQCGKHVYLPAFASHGRVDLIFEDSHGLHRVQCKSARLVGDALSFRTCSNTNNHPRGYAGEVDFFLVYSPELNEVFLVPAEVVPTRTANLRLGPARNGQSVGVRLASDYALSRLGRPAPPEHGGPGSA